MTNLRQSSTPSSADERLLREAIELSAAAVHAGELPYASLLADTDGTIVARAHNTVTSSGDVTAHPELELARQAAMIHSREQRGQLTLYTSCEPCTMCRNVIARAGLGRVVFALSTDQLHQLQPAGQPRPDDAPVQYDGPDLFAEAAPPINAYYKTGHDRRR